MRVSVIIATLNRRALLKSCLKSLFQQTYRGFEIIVVDGGSTDGTSELAQRFSIRFLRQDGRFQPSGLNYGIRHAAGEILVLIDDDIIADENWLANIVTRYEDSNVAGVGGRVVIPGLDRMAEDNPSSYLALRNAIFSATCEYKLAATGKVLRGGYVTSNLDKAAGGPIQVDTFQGSSMSFRRRVFESIGLFDESYVPSAFRLETAFCLKAIACGFRLIYAPDAVVYHQIHGSHGSWAEGPALGKRLWHNSYNQFLFVMRGRNEIPRFSWIRFLILQLLSAEEGLRLAVRRKKLAYLRGSLGTLAAFRSWLSNTNYARTGKTGTLEPIGQSAQLS